MIPEATAFVFVVGVNPLEPAVSPAPVCLPQPVVPGYAVSGCWYGRRGLSIGASHGTGIFPACAMLAGLLQIVEDCLSRKFILTNVPSCYAGFVNGL
jgi:hypothetical protein